jgi:transcriptional regulator with XRE-family HTH domain
MTNTLRLRRAERGPKGVSQMDIARTLGMSFNRYWRIENDQTDPSTREIKAFARYFKVDAVVLFPSLASPNTANDGATL